MRLLVVEDELKMAAYLRQALLEQGHEVVEAHDGEEALARAMGETFDAMVLDLNLPRLDGLSALRQLRAVGNSTPVLIVSARGEMEDRVTGLQLGGDDYLPKPFSMDELLARVGALLRKADARNETQFSVGDLTVDPATRTVTRAGQRIDLPMREYGLLEHLARFQGRTLSRAQILEHVWGYHFDPGTNIVDVYVQRLRRRLDDGHAERLIHTVPGLGYRLSLKP